MPRQGHDDVHALAAAGLEERLQTQLFQHSEHHLRGLDHAAPGQCRIGIKVQHEMVRRFDPVTRRAPGMQLDGAHLRSTDQCRHRIYFHQRGMPGVKGTIQLPDVRDRQVLGVFLEKLLTVDTLRTAQQCHGTLIQVGQNPVGDGLVKLRKLDLAGAGLAVDDAVRMTDPGARHINFSLRGLFARLGRCRCGWSLAGHLGRLSVFTHHVLGVLVAAQSDKGGLADDTFTGPLGELGFADQLRLHPLHATGLGRGEFSGQR